MYQANNPSNPRDSMTKETSMIRYTIYLRIQIFCIFRLMKKQVLTIGLLSLFLAMLYLPDFPLLSYYLGQQRLTISNADNTPEKVNTLIGDIRYLQALIERTDDCEKTTKAPEPPPKTQNNSINIVYLLTANSVQRSENSVNFNFLPYQFIIKDCIILKNNPPPKA